jgi:hypothetical protein
LLAQLSLKEKDIKEEVPNNREKEIFLENNWIYKGLNIKFEKWMLDYFNFYH